MPHCVAFYQVLHCMLGQNQYLENYIFLETIICDPSIHLMYQSDITNQILWNILIGLNGQHASHKEPYHPSTHLKAGHPIGPPMKRDFLHAVKWHHSIPVHILKPATIGPPVKRDFLNVVKWRYADGPMISGWDKWNDFSKNRYEPFCFQNGISG